MRPHNSSIGSVGHVDHTRTTRAPGLTDTVRDRLYTPILAIEPSKSIRAAVVTDTTRSAG